MNFELYEIIEVRGVRGFDISSSIHPYSIYYDILDYGGYRGPAGCWYSVERPAADVAQ